jgi:hypothetical protein
LKLAPDPSIEKLIEELDIMPGTFSDVVEHEGNLDIDVSTWG